MSGRKKAESPKRHDVMHFCDPKRSSCATKVKRGIILLFCSVEKKLLHFNKIIIDFFSFFLLLILDI